jgi:predicted nuclease of predicted toxin-antitoxin system
MRFLVDAGMPRATAEVIRSFGHDAIDVRESGWGSSPDEVIAAAAQRERRCIVTRDLDFADIRVYPPEQFEGLMVLRLPDAASHDFILGLVREVFASNELISLLPKRLAIVEVERVRLRPSP